MKRFIINALAVGAVVLIIGLLIEFLLLNIENEYSYKKNYIEEKGDAIKVLVLGHSHTVHGLNPAIMGDSIFNMSIAARVYSYYDAELAKRYIKNLPNLKVVIWPFGYNFQYRSYLYPDVWPIDNGLCHSVQCMYEKYMGISYEKYIPYAHWSELICSKFDYIGRIFKPSEKRKEYNIDGYHPLTGKVPDWKNHDLPELINYTSINFQKVFQENVDNMKQIAELCKEANVRLVVLWCPYYKTARDLVTERGLKEREQCLDSMRSVCPSMEYLDFSKDERFTEDDFYDSTHLNDNGADKFSRILKDTLNL